jgi:hypothetical protein
VLLEGLAEDVEVEAAVIVSAARPVAGATIRATRIETNTRRPIAGHCERLCTLASIIRSPAILCS